VLNKKSKAGNVIYQVATAILTLLALLVVGQRNADLAEFVDRDRINLDPAGSSKLVGSIFGRLERISSNRRWPIRSETNEVNEQRFNDKQDKKRLTFNVFN
jgi:hypothetical protein